MRFLFTRDVWRCKHIRIKTIMNYRAAYFHYVDDLVGQIPFADYFEEIHREWGEPLDIPAIKAALAKAWISLGWEGDGDFTVFALPPFLAGIGSNVCQPAFHVKQGNNGTSYLAWPKDLCVDLTGGGASFSDGMIELDLILWNQ
jgi:hypothetical protein